MKDLHNKKSMELFAFFKKIYQWYTAIIFYKAYTVLLFSKPGQFNSLYILTAFQIYFFLFSKSLDEQNLYEIIRPRSFIFGKCHIETFIAVLYNLSK